MKKFKKSINALRLLLKNPWLLNHILDEELYWKKRVKKEFGFSSGLPQIDLTSLFGDDYCQTISPMAMLDGGSTAPDLALLVSLARKYKVQNYLEIGTWRGESVANVASVVPNCYTLNLPDQTLREMGLPDEYISAHRFFSSDLPNVTHLQGDSRSFDFKSPGKAFDLIFVDGDHHSEAVQTDTASVFSVVEPEKGIIVWHDYGINPEKIRWSVLYGILKGSPRGLHHRLFHVSNTLCAVFLPEAAGPFFSTFLKTNAPPQKYFEVTIKVIKNKAEN